MGAPVRVGDLLADKCEVTRILGQGGSVVVAARHREFDKLVTGVPYIVLEYFEAAGIIHRDLKPQNYVAAPSYATDQENIAIASNRDGDGGWTAAFTRRS